MQLNCRCKSATFLVLGLIGSIGATDSAAQSQQETGKNASDIVGEFRAAWNDGVWEPAGDRRGGYMRPADDTGWKTRFQTLQQLAKLGSGAVPVLVESLKDDSSAVRALAAQALGYCGSPDARESLAQLVENDPEGVVRLYAADSLGMLGGGDHKELLRRLEPDEKNSDAKRHLVYALDRNGDALEPDVVDQLKEWNAQQLDSARLNERAPDFELQSLDGQSVRLSQFHGKKSVVLVFVYGDT